jgi:hypothetical protein
VSDDVLSLRALNRATLARQLLLERRPMAPLDAVDHLVGLQAQVPHNPYHALWSRLEGFDRLRPRLRTFRDERGRELFDLADAPRPDADTPAPPRFLPEYDNALLSHADRTRFMAKDDLRGLPWGAAPLHGAVLVDGRGFGTWHIDRDKVDGGATLVIDHVGRLAGRDADAVGHEGLCLLRFLAPDATAHDVRLAVHA